LQLILISLCWVKYLSNNEALNPHFREDFILVQNYKKCLFMKIARKKESTVCYATLNGGHGYLDQSVNGIQQYQICRCQITLLYLMYVRRSFAYYYHSVKGISLGLTQSESIKLVVLYLQ
jgi:hypothetical protein